MAHIVIDGYNYLHRVGSAVFESDLSAEFSRKSFLDRLAGYRRGNGGKITVVFDAYRSISFGRQRENHKGIEVVYSAENETADDVIIGWIREKRAGLVVVSSDRAIIDEAKRQGTPFLTPLRMEQMVDGSDDGAPDESDDEARQGRKKGNARKLPKKLRKVIKTIDKI